jgi:DNA-binding MarR family transcriptional regulator
LARHMYDLRRRRDLRFGADLFSEPAWDLLLYLYIAGNGRGAICVSDACYGAAAPLTTALRWLRQLEETGLIVREDDPADARRVYVRLSAKAAKKMRKLLKAGCPSSRLEP